MLKRAGHAVQTLVLAGQRAAARAGVPAEGLRGTFTFITRLQDMISKIRARGQVRLMLNELYTPHAAQTTGGARRDREVVLKKPASWRGPALYGGYCRCRSGHTELGSNDLMLPLLNMSALG